MNVTFLVTHILIVPFVNLNDTPIALCTDNRYKNVPIAKAVSHRYNHLGNDECKFEIVKKKLCIVQLRIYEFLICIRYLLILIDIHYG